MRIVANFVNWYESSTYNKYLILAYVGDIVITAIVSSAITYYIVK